MPVAPLLAPAGVEMRVVSQAASFTWGSWDVSWPDGFEPPDPPAEDRELGWVADLEGVEVEPFGRCFVRADAQIDATLGRSNVEDVLDAAKYRTSGEVFVETEIPFENLAGQLPYRDFDVNSLVPVRLGGRILEDQLVTKVEESEDEAGARSASVYIGGQKFQDREALRTRNREIDRVIAQERLERGDEIGARLAASQEYEREQRDKLKEYVDEQDVKVAEHADTVANTAETNAKAHAEEEDKELKRDVDLIIGPEGSLTRQLQSLNDDYTSKLGENGTVIADQAAHQRMLSGIVHGTPVSELEGTAFRQQQQAVNEMNDVFRNRQTSINSGFDYLFGLNEKINLAQDYTIAYHRILAESRNPIRFWFSEVPYENRSGITEYMWGEKPVKDEMVGKYKINRESIEFELRRGGVGWGVVVGQLTGRFRGRLEYLTCYGLIVNVGGSFGTPSITINVSPELIDTFDDDVVLAPRTFDFDGVIFPSEVWPYFRRQIEDLDAEYRAKGLRV